MNVTFPLDDALLKKAKLLAARRDTSVAQLVRNGLEQQVALEAPLQRHGANGTYEILMGYSLGEVPRGVAMEELGLDHYRELLALLGAAALPMPTVPAATRAEMVNDLLAVLRDAGALKKSKPSQSLPAARA
jgi:hypothetical protein